ncbi:MAG: hypothetical protein CMP48_09620 [Rickettsiales bacterium]|nr:hypothetical protein [Rickettsiales bacterium]|tara:strand:+ start:187 stop:519 length:333 start_codon:yes stop_codon:yes gene_type:complete
MTKATSSTLFVLIILSALAACSQSKKPVTLQYRDVSDYIKIYRKDKKTVITRMTMKSVESILPEGFVRVHRSYIVAKNKVEQYNSKQISIDNQQIPVERKYVTVVSEYFN